MRVNPYRISLAASVCMLFCALPSVAQQSIELRIDRLISSEMRKQKIPGISLAIIRHGRVDILKSYGLANVEHQVRVKPETVFQSGSIAKQFTAAALMILVEEGKLSLDDKISKYFTDAPESWKNITVRHLLTHTSGMGEYPPDLDLRRDLTEDEYLAIIKSIPLAYATGAKWDYSNLGYVALGILIRKITGKFYGDFMAERLTNRDLSQLDRGHVLEHAPEAPDRRAAAAQYDDGSCYLRSRHRSEPRCRISSRERRIEESGMGFAFNEHDGRRVALFHDFGLSQMGCCSLHR